MATGEQKQLAFNQTVSDMYDLIHGSAIINIEALLLTRLPCTDKLVAVCAAAGAKSRTYVDPIG